MIDIYNKSTYYYDLPTEQIAQHPVEPRDSSRLLVYNRKEKSIEHKHFYDILDYLKKGDVLIVNNTKVLPARLIGVKEETGAVIELLLQKRLNLTNWMVLAKPAKRCKVGTIIKFSDKLSAEIVATGEYGDREVKFIFDGIFEEILLEVGTVPLPHYIHEKADINRYQTVYAKHDGSSAAPTAGLHFTPELLEKIKQKGVTIANVLLHVGIGTFRPVKEDNILKHDMHSEHYEISQETCDIINSAKKEGRRVIAVGTTSVRVLESCADEVGHIKPGFGETKIFIYPGYKFKILDALITNFHLPESTLIMLVSAFAGVQETLNFYNVAVKEKYRFFSFGDACFIYWQKNNIKE